MLSFGGPPEFWVCRALYTDSPDKQFGVCDGKQQFCRRRKLDVAHFITVSNEVLKAALVVVHEFHKPLCQQHNTPVCSVCYPPWQTHNGWSAYQSKDTICWTWFISGFSLGIFITAKLVHLQRPMLCMTHALIHRTFCKILFNYVFTTNFWSDLPFFAGRHMPPSRTNAEACLTGWPNAQSHV